MFCRINFVRMPHERWMKCKPNPDSLPDFSRWVLSFLPLLSMGTLGGASLPSFLVRYHHRPFIIHVLFNVGVFVICMLPLPYSPTCSIYLICFWHIFSSYQTCLHAVLHLEATLRFYLLEARWFWFPISQSLSLSIRKRLEVNFLH